MSSEGSVTSNGSRIRQFGLYRTIDARTEEFLRSSRKRQIRQGCACAAISTAITVTVVVSVILVYEYSINSESNVNKKISLKPNWFGLMNDSEISSISSKFNKKINFDRTTLKLLPILLKALNKNRYLEKILEDYSSSSPPYVGKDSTEATFTRNIFSDSKNWLKMPTSKLYTVDYKTSPLIYWKSPTKRLEYLTKIRKIRDYQRMLNYFDKMISDKVGSNSRRDYGYTENPIIDATISMKKEKMKKIQELKHPLESIKNVKEFKTEDKDGFVGCKCPKKLGYLLSKLITSIQDMVPNMINNKLGLHSCVNETKPVEILHELTTPRAVRQTKKRISHKATTISLGIINKSTQKTTTKLTTRPPKLRALTRKMISISNVPRTYFSLSSSTTSTTTSSTTPSTTPSTTASTTQSTTTSTTARTTGSTPTSSTVTDMSTTTEGSYININSLESSTIPILTIANTVNPYYQLYEKNTLDYDSIVKPTDIPQLDNTTTPKITSTTEMFVPIKFIDSSNEGSSEKFFDAYTVEPANLRSTVPLFRDDEYDDYFMTTAKTNNNFANLNVHSTESFKTKMITPQDDDYKTLNNNRKIQVNSKALNYHPVIKQKDLNLASMRKMADMIYLPHEKIAKEWKYNIGSKHIVSPYISDPELRLHTKSKITNSVESNNSISKTKILSSLKNSIKITSTMPYGKNEQQDTKLGLEQGNSENVGEEEFQDEYGMRQAESSTRKTYKYRNSSKKNNTNIEKGEQPSPWDLLKYEEKMTSASSKSMLPSMRPIYLEVQRNNEWRQDDHPDYDINFNNNIFDLPNIN